MRLAACCHTRLRGPSNTSAATSSPRRAGRQWRKTAEGAARPISSAVTWYPANAARRSAVWSSWPIETHTSVQTTSAPATASVGTVVSSGSAPARRTRSRSSPPRPKPAGLATRTFMPAMAPARHSERHTLLASPTQATVRPARLPSSWRTVSRSARAWSGWAWSESRLTTGTGLADAIRSTVAW